MAANGAATETQDLSGSTLHFNGTVNTTAVSIPSVSNKVLAEFCLSCPVDQAPSNRLLVSMDGGTTYFSIPAGGCLIWSPKGYKRQILIKGSAANVKYETIMNFEVY